MTIDYDRLRELADEHTPGPWVRHPDQPRALCNLDTKFLVHHEMVTNRGMEPSAEDVANTELIALAPDMARELLRLHRELVDLCALMVSHADSLHLDGHHYAAKHIFNHTNRFTRILEGDTE